MGSQSFTTYSRGKNVNDAYNRAVEIAEDEYGHQEGYSGAINSSSGCRDITKEFKASKKDLNKFINEQMDKLSKHNGAQAICVEEPKSNNNKIKTQVEHVVTPGTKKWVLTYIVYHHSQRVTITRTKGEAVRIAREYSEKHQCPTTIRMEKSIENIGDNLVAKITYKRASDERDGKWIFFGWASC
jgi:hypothetical protein